MKPSSGRRQARLPGLIVVLAGAAVGPGVASAATPGAACLEIADTAERLACFDREIGAAVHGATAAVPRRLPRRGPQQEKLRSRRDRRR